MYIAITECLAINLIQPHLLYHILLKKCLEPQIEQSTLKTSTAVTELSPNIFLNTFSTVSHLKCLSFLKFHFLMSLHDGRSQKVSWAAKVLLYFKDIYCSDWPVS